MTSIAIDGPSGAGKSTLARRLARALGFLYIDTGAIYRTVALHVQRAGVDPGDAEAVAGLLPGMELSLMHGGDGLQHMYLAGENVTEAIRLHEISHLASRTSAIPAVRAFLLETQRKLAQEHDVVMDGRDIGTVVLPDAAVKIFLTADAEARAQRRQKELADRGQQTAFETVLHDIQQRDRQDRERAISPLCQAEGAVLLDTTALDLEGSLQALLTIVRERL